MIICLCLFIYLSIYFFFITINSNLFSVQFINLVMFNFSKHFQFEFYTLNMRYRTSYWRQNFQICRNLFSCSVFSSFFFSFTLCDKLCYSDHASFLDGFCDSLAGVLFFYYSLHKSQYQIKYNLEITSKRQNWK